MKYSNDRIEKCAERFLERRGYLIRERVESEGAPVIVAENDEVIAIAKVSASDDGFPDDILGREAFERIAADYLADHPDAVDRSVRADHIDPRNGLCRGEKRKQARRFYLPGLRFFWSQRADSNR